MIERKLSWKETLSHFGLWLLILALSAVVAFQLHATLVALFWFVLQTPSLRPTAWNSTTISAIARFLYLVVGGGWLFGISFVDGFLTETHRRGQLRPRIFRLLGWLGGAYLACYLILLLATWLA
ncbi:MAG: hypothetical protein OT477_15595 [Chloroflexi bacterium]|nr:hypothetical protein [Chloroflexota bacterium]